MTSEHVVSDSYAPAYWAHAHAEIVRRLPTLIEYVQHHFSATDHGFWRKRPATEDA